VIYAAGLDNCGEKLVYAFGRRVFRSRLSSQPIKWTKGNSCSQWRAGQRYHGRRTPALRKWFCYEGHIKSRFAGDGWMPIQNRSDLPRATVAVSKRALQCLHILRDEKQIGRSALAARLGVSLRSTFRYTDQLVDAGFLGWKRLGATHPNQYITIPYPEAPSKSDEKRSGFPMYRILLSSSSTLTF